MNEREKLIYYIDEVSFYLDDLRLFLDTHPCNTQALELYNQNAAYRKVLVQQYIETFGPLNFYDFNVCDTWVWAKYPWPWEGVCK